MSAAMQFDHASYSGISVGHVEDFDAQFLGVARVRWDELEELVQAPAITVRETYQGIHLGPISTRDLVFLKRASIRWDELRELVP